MAENKKKTEKEEQITLDLLPKEGERVLQELRGGNMVIVRERNNFLYIVEFNKQYHMFSHTPGAAGGGQRQFPVNEKYEASIRKLTDLADMAYICVFDRELNLYGVLSSAEEGILAMFPGEDRDADEDVEFAPWDRKKKDKSEKMPTDGAAGSDFPSENFDDLFKVE
jgi:hypothetical protein